MYVISVKPKCEVLIIAAAPDAIILNILTFETQDSSLNVPTFETSKTGRKPLS